MYRKTCIGCKLSKPASKFQQDTRRKDGLLSCCKECVLIRQKELRLKTRNSYTHKYEKTKKGFLMRLYRNMQSRVTGVQRTKFHLYKGLELLAREQFYSWALRSSRFHNLFKRWESSGYDRTLTPSVDRVNSKRGYTLDNIQWLTHSENSAKASSERWAA